MGAFTVLVPVGGGGLASGVATAVRSLRPEAVVFGVEPALAADARDSLSAGHIVRWDSSEANRTIADGQRGSAIGVLPFAHLSTYLAGILTVDEDDICRAMVRAQRDARLVLEPSGATSLAALHFALPDDAATGAAIGYVGPKCAQLGEVQMVVVLVVEGRAALNEGLGCPSDDVGRRSEHRLCGDLDQADRRKWACAWHEFLSARQRRFIPRYDYSNRCAP